MSDTPIYTHNIESRSKLRRETNNFNIVMKDVRSGEISVPEGEKISLFRSYFACDPNAADPTKPVYGLYKILPKNLKGEDFIGMVIESATENSSTGSLYDPVISMVVCTEYNNFGSNVPEHIALTLSDQNVRTPLYYIPATGYFGTEAIVHPMLLDLGCVEYQGANNPITLDVKPNMTVSELRDLILNEDDNTTISIDYFEDGYIQSRYGSIEAPDGGGVTIHAGRVTVQIEADGSVRASGDAGWHDTVITIEIRTWGN